MWIFALVAGLGLIGLGLWAREMGMRSQKWRATEGEIVEARVDDFDTDNIQPILVYTYQVKDKELRGSRISFSGRGANREEVEKLISRYAPKQKVTVYYDPASPSSCVLENTPSKDWSYWVSGGAFFLATALFLLIRH